MMQKVVMKSKLQILLLVWYAVLGLVNGILISRNIREPLWWTVGSALFNSVAIFYWYRADSDHQGFKRTFLMNIAVVVFSMFAIPFYILRSNAHGRRLRALWRMLGYYVLACLAWVVGGLASFLV
jgi:hypothetical protein